MDDLHKDLLAEKDKPLYSKYKLGIVEYGPQWEEETQREVSMISIGMEKFAAGRPEAYIKYANEEIESCLLQPFLQCTCLTEETETLPQMKRLFCHLHRSSSQTQL